MLLRDRIARVSLYRLSAAALFLVLSVSASIAQTGASSQELPNFHQVNEQLYRGAQPKREGITQLSALGIKTVLNLREEDEQTRAEASAVRAAGLRYYSVPMHGLGRPTDEQVKAALSIINAEENWPVFVHCKRGADRTGTVVAIYRISHDNWTSERALTEARRYGLSRFELGMKHYIEDYGKRPAPRIKDESERVKDESSPSSSH